MKRKFVLKAGIILAILLLVLPISVESIQAGLHVDSMTGGPSVKVTVSTTSIETNISITCSVKGGFFPFSRSWTTVDTLRIDPGNPWTVRWFILGFGNNIHFTVTATSSNSGNTTGPITIGPEHIFLFFTW
ncbi:MAG: hypothetical protein NTX92_06675 [Euryarchaeota archaeon]|jgi:hypothetical protein|nr:hypothetical protein [Euryarchaeota archaeon]